MKNAEYESSPWSNSSPSGPDSPIRRACFPSIPSRVYARNMFTAAMSQNHLGIGVQFSQSVLAQNPQSYQESTAKFSTVNRKPANVITFGATHFGKY